jgi:hypothetical protein
LPGLVDAGDAHDGPPNQRAAPRVVDGLGEDVAVVGAHGVLLARSGQGSAAYPTVVSDAVVRHVPTGQVSA